MRLLLFAVLAGYACGGTSARRPAASNPSAPAGGEAAGFDIEQAMARESEQPPARQTVEITDIGFRGALGGTGPLRYERREQAVTVHAPIGGDADLICTFHAEMIDLATSLRMVHEGVKARFPRTEVKWITAGFEGDSGFLDLGFLYVVDTPEGPKVGLLKLRGANVAEHGVICLHDELGFLNTFDQATRMLLASAPPRSGTDRYLVSIQDQPVGVGTGQTISERAGGHSWSRASFLIARAPDALMAHDTGGSTSWARDGELLEDENVEDDNGEISSYRLKRQKRGEYHVEGTHLGRPFEGTIRPPRPLLADDASLQAAAKALVGATSPAPVKHLVYDDSNPLGHTETTYTLREAAGTDRAWIVMSSEGTEVAILVRRTGEMDELEMQIAGLRITMKRMPD